MDNSETSWQGEDGADCGDRLLGLANRFPTAYVRVLASAPSEVQGLFERGHSDGESGERQRAATSGGTGL